LARKRHRAVAVWVAIGAVTGPIALLLLERAPLGRCPTCDAVVHGWATVCVWCGGDVRHARRVAPTVAAPLVAAPPAPASPPSRPAVTAAVAPAATASATKASRRRPTTTIAERAATSRAVSPAVSAMTVEPDAPDGPEAPDAADAPATVPAPPPPKPRTRRSTGKARDAAAATGGAAAGKAAAPPVKRATRGRTSAAAGILTTTPIDFRTLASAVFVTGSVGFQPGSWYTLETDGTDLRVLGPLDRDARAIALSRPLAPLDASAVNGRLVVNGADGLVMVFMRMAGMSAEDVAALIERTDVGTGAPG
jgi:hypothetical protein